MLIMVGLTVLGLLIVFFAGRFITQTTLPEVSFEATSQNANQGLAQEPEPPGFEDAPDLTEPQLQDTLQALTNAVSQTDAIYSEEAYDADTLAGKGKGPGDNRMPGTGGDGVVERVPRWERWKIRFEPKGNDAYSAWLDFHKIRVGVLDQRNNQVHLAYDFHSGRKVEAAPPTQYRYPQWKLVMPVDPPLPGLTRELAQQAGISRHGSIILLFVPFDVERLLWTIENEHSDGRDVNTIRETIFRVQPDGAGFRFEVIDQKYF